ncbi:MAG: ExeM/NucH family extracellular endonuclease [Arthrobacter sp.]|nr:ExeM/NucH family extracellular endonuclease [Arthrobacter sp.]
MGHLPSRLPRAVLGAVLGAGLLAAPLVAAPAIASPDGQGLLIHEAYLKGGSANAAYKNKFVELYNPGPSALSLSGLYLQYRSATSTSAPSASNTIALQGTVASKGYFLLKLGSNGETGSELTGWDQEGGLNPSGTTGTLAITRSQTALTDVSGNLAGHAGVVDVLGYGASNTFEGAVAAVDGGNTTPNALQRSNFVDTDNNAADFVSGTQITPEGTGGQAGGGTDPQPPVEAGEKSIAEIQGTGAASPLVGQQVTTRGRVTAAYAEGGFNGYYLQSAGTGGALGADHTASDAVFVYSKDTVGQVKVGDYVQVTGTVAEYNDQTQLEVAAGKASVLDDAGVPQVRPATVGYPSTQEGREALEGMLIAPQGDFTVTDNYDANYYGQLGLVTGTTPLLNPTVKGLPGTPAYEAEIARANQAAVGLDDGSSLNFNSNANKSIELPYLSTTDPVRVGAKVTFTQPVILDYRNGEWKFQPTQRLTTANAASVQPATFSNTRTAQPEDVGGDIRLAGFNVLNYFTTLGEDLKGCSSYTDRAGTPITVNTGCNARGAWSQESFKRQQSKIVDAINALGANVVSLEEIENSLTVDGHDRDEALAALVAALNADDSLSGGEWDYVRSPQQLPAKEDVIRTAFIYKKDSIEVLGDSVILDDAAFSNARQPLAQHFKAKGSSTDFVVIANHLKSKGDSSKSASGDNVDKGDGVGAYNGDRTRQAAALVDFAKRVQEEAGTSRAFLIGDFNSYAAEDPITTIEDAGFINQGAKSGKETYAFGGATGSLDYVFASKDADAIVSGVDEWNINSVESVALEYSRYNYNALNLYAEGPYRSSDHDPVVVGLNTADAPASDTKRLNLLNINDFHGRIDANTVKFAGTIESLKAQYPDSTAFLSAGDNIGASLFASSVAQDAPTIDVLNALGLAASATGNHEFDQGADDLTGRVSSAANFDYLAANVLKDGKPLLDGYKIVDVDGVKVGVIGAITQETPSLVSPGGIAGLEFTDPVEAVNRVAAQLSDGDEANGEADVLVAEYHEGTSDGVSNESTLEQALEHGGVFKRLAEETSAKVDVVFNGHTHAQYAWDVAVPGSDGVKRPVLQTGSYGEFIGQVVLDYNTKTGETTTVLNHNVARSKADDADLVAAYPAVAQVKTITEAALAKAAEVGNQKIGEASAPITTAMIDGVRDDRASESTLGNLVADALLSKLSSAERGSAEIGVVNPGGLRADLAAGDITYAQANAVLPFLNNLWTTTLTGAQFKTVLEQQFQRNADGTVPSRAYLQLGLSKNVTYTYDAAREEGDRITSISVNGAPIDPKRDYRIGSFSFLLQGGDNFREFAQGKDTKDTGLVDRDAWIDYLKEAGTVSPSYERRAISVSGLPTAALTPGKSYTLSFDKLDLTSTGVPAVTSITAGAASPLAAARAAAPLATDADASYGTADVSEGAAELKITIPADAAEGTRVLVSATPTGTSFVLPTAVGAGSEPGANAGSDDDASAGADGADASAGADGSDASAGADGSDTSAGGSDASAGAEGSDASTGAEGSDASAGAEGSDASGGANGADGANADSGAQAEAGQGGDDSLANTGAQVGGWALGGALTLLAGVGALLAARARRRSEA